MDVVLTTRKLTAKPVRNLIRSTNAVISLNSEHAEHVGARDACAAEMAAGPLVLVVDDARDNREGYAEYLHFCGFRIVQAADGEEAVAQAQRHRPDVIVLDMRLPAMSGMEVARTLRADGFTHTVIIALSACVAHADITAAMESGCDAFLAKPCMPDLLWWEIRALLNPLDVK
jgi:CheY-like chemotaxis protein